MHSSIRPRSSRIYSLCAARLARSVSEICTCLCAFGASARTNRDSSRAFCSGFHCSSGVIASTRIFGDSSSLIEIFPVTTTTSSSAIVPWIRSKTFGKISPSMEPVRSSSVMKPMYAPFLVAFPFTSVSMPPMATWRPSRDIP